MRFVALCLGGLCFAGLGCGGSIASDGGADTGTASGTDGGVIATETGVSEGGTGICTVTNDTFSLQVSGGGVTMECSTPTTDAGPPDRAFRGAIVAVERDSFQLDRCSPAADCVPMITTFKASAAGLDLRTALRKGSYVDVNARMNFFWTCQRSIRVTTIAAWDGVKNPVDVGEKLYLIATEGSTSVSGSPFEVSTIAQGCFPGKPSCGGPAPDYYRLLFRSTSSSLTVTMGETQFGLTDAKGQPYVVRNLRSLADGYCDSYWDWAYWITPAATR